MRRRDAKTIVAYYYEIPAMRGLLERERYDLEGRYDALRSSSANAVPHGSTVGRPTEAQVEKTAGQKIYERLHEIAKNIQTWDADEAAIRTCLNALHGRYKKLLDLRYRRMYSWTKIALTLNAPDSTVQNWHGRALDRLGEVLEEVPQIDGILDRASRARF